MASLARLVAVLALACPVLLAGAPAAVGAAPGAVEVRTVPATAGVRLLVGSVTFITGSDGTATAFVPDLTGLSSRVQLVDASVGRSRLAVTRVTSQATGSSQRREVTVGLDVWNTVRLRVHPGTTGVGRDQVDRLRLHSSRGTVVTVDPRSRRSADLLAWKTTFTSGRLVARQVTWTVDSIHTTAGMAVTTGRTPFRPALAATWGIVLHTVRGTVIVETVPRTPGVRVALDGSIRTTDPSGRAVLATDNLNGVAERTTLAGQHAGGVRVAVARVSPLPPEAPFQRRVLIALSVERPVALRYTDPAGNPVANTRVSAVQLAGDGRTVTLEGAATTGPVWLTASVGRRVGANRWQGQPVQWRVLDVTVDGGQAVFEGQQRIEPEHTSTWNLQLSLYDVSIQATDLIFGSPVGFPATVSGPGGLTQEVAVDSDGSTVLRSLVRGDYVITADSGVFGPPTSVKVSQEQLVDMRVVTLMDILVVAVVLLLVVASLIGTGLLLRRHQRRLSGRTDPCQQLR